VRYWDTSAIIPLLSDEDTTDAMTALLGSDPNIVVWAFTPIEIASALWRKHRTTRDDVSRVAAQRRLAVLVAKWTYVDDFDTVLKRAHQTVSRHALKAADALQLAAALVAARNDLQSLTFVSLDRDLIVAAHTEGFTVLP
jgi:uncharacterized protein